MTVISGMRLDDVPIDDRVKAFSKGTVLSYSDMANPRREFVVEGIEKNKQFGNSLILQCLDDSTVEFLSITGGFQPGWKVVFCPMDSQRLTGTANVETELSLYYHPGNISSVKVNSLILIQFNITDGKLMEFNGFSWSEINSKWLIDTVKDLGIVTDELETYLGLVL